MLIACDLTGRRNETIFVTAPVNITRVSSTTNVLSLTAYVSHYEILDDGDRQDPSPVYSIGFDVSPDDHNFEQFISFNLTATTSWRDVYLQIVVTSLDGQDRNTQEGAIIAHDATTGVWSARVTGEYSHERNEMIIAIMNSEVLIDTDITPDGNLGEVLERTDELSETSPSSNELLKSPGNSTTLPPT